MAEMKFLLLALGCLLAFGISGRGASADLILHHGKIVTVDNRFSVQEAVAIKNGRITAVGRNDEILKQRGPQTESVDLHLKMVLPGLMDSHAHPADACMTEF